MFCFHVYLNSSSLIVIASSALVTTGLTVILFIAHACTISSFSSSYFSSLFLLFVTRLGISRYSNSYNPGFLPSIHYNYVWSLSINPRVTLDCKISLGSYTHYSQCYLLAYARTISSRPYFSHNLQ